MSHRTYYSHTKAMTFDIHDPLYLNSTDLQSEFTRILDVCNGCRLCDGLCPSFNNVFDRIEEEDDKLSAAGHGKENPVRQLTKTDYDNVVDFCYQCKLCYPKCPYTPPHEYMLDFPRLLLRADAIKAHDEGKTIKQKIRDEITGDTDRAGAIAALAPGLANWGATNTLARTALEAVAGIDKRKKLPEYAKETFHHWFAKWAAGSPPTTREFDVTIPQTPDPKPQPEKVALFYTCMIDQNKPWIGKQYVEILKHFGIEVVVPEQECCGMPELGAAKLSKVTASIDRNIERFLPFVESGYKIIAMSPSCSMMLRLDQADYATNKENARKVMAAVMDPCEYLMKLYRAKKIDFEWKASIGEKITYHAPCHLRVQNIGFNSRDLMKMIPGVTVTMVQQCSGHDGAWSSKKEYYEISLDVGKKLFKAIEKDKPALVAGDCTLAHLHIEEGTGEESLHPIEVIYKAMGLPRVV